MHDSIAGALLLLVAAMGLVGLHEGGLYMIGVCLCVSVTAATGVFLLLAGYTE